MYKIKDHELYNAKCNYSLSLNSLKLFFIVLYIQNMLLIYLISTNIFYLPTYVEIICNDS